MKTYDVIIIGAGIAGLSCARTLSENCLSVLILEGRERVGGRIYSDTSCSYPIELGAEFIHGVPMSILDPLRNAKQPFVDACDNHLYFKKGKLQESKHYWERLEKLFRKLRSDQKKDRTVSEFVAATQRKTDPDTMELFRTFVEGFHSADLDQMGERGLALSEQGEKKNRKKTLNGSILFRPLPHYSELVQAMVSEKLNAPILFGQKVQRVEWQKRQVKVSCQTETYRARRAVITVPISILKSNDPQTQIEISPQPKGLKKALAQIHMGHVIRITFEFQSCFWEKLSKEPIVFLHAGPQFYFPTWWTQAPLRTPILVAWQGGPKALELSEWTEASQVETALQTLSEITGEKMRFLKQHLKKSYSHSWSKDPFSLGAYSYAGLEGEKYSRWLSRPIEDTLYFAGEAMALANERGTVHGAMASGLRAARQIMEST